MQAHSDGTTIIAVQGSVRGMSKPECMEEHAEIEGVISSFRQRVILRLLSAQADGGAELYFPTDAGAIEEEDVRACRASKVEIGSPIAVGVAVREFIA